MATNNSVNAPLVANAVVVGNSAGTAYSDVVTVDGGVLSANSSGVPVYSSALTLNALVLGGGTGVPTVTSAFSANGQLAIGNGSSAPAIATLTAGTGISITNGAGSITIASNGQEQWVDETGAAVTMATNTGYTSDDGATLVVFTLPATSAIGDFVEINGKGLGLWSIAQATGQQIHMGNQSTTSGSGGSLSSSLQYDNVRLRCLTANTIWTVVSSQGNLTYV